MESRILDLLTGDGARESSREVFREMLRNGELDNRMIEIDVPMERDSGVPSFIYEMGSHLAEFFQKLRNSDEKSTSVSYNFLYL